jgi:hypothetical protein
MDVSLLPNPKVEVLLRNRFGLRSVCHTGKTECSEEMMLFLLLLWSTLPALLLPLYIEKHVGVCCISCYRRLGVHNGLSQRRSSGVKDKVYVNLGIGIQ